MKTQIILIMLALSITHLAAQEQRYSYYPSSGCSIRKYENGELTYAEDSDFENLELIVQPLKRNPQKMAFRYKGELYLTERKCLRPVSSISNDDLSHLQVEESGEAKKNSGFSSRNGDSWHFGAGFSYGGKANAKWEKGKVTSISNEATTELEFDSASTFALEARKMSRNSWGVMLGYALEEERAITNYTFSLAGSSISINTSGSAKLKNSFAYLNAVYRWKYFYLPFGFNYSSIKFTPASNNSSVTWNFSGALGGQLGVGYYISENVALELLSRVLGVGLKIEDQSKSASIIFSDGYFSYGELALKAFF